MKKLILSGLLMAVSLANYAQKSDSVKTKSTINSNNEIKLNLLYSVLGLPEINYERLIGNDMGVGVGLLLGLEKETTFKFGVIPNFRVYFGGKKASGFFIEANTAILSIDDTEYSYVYTSSGGYFETSKKNSSVNFGLGAAAGGKFLTKSGFVGEAYFGLGRVFGNDYEEVYPRIGITIGKRF